MPKPRPKFQAWDFIPTTHQANLPALGTKCYFVCSDLKWPEHFVDTALLVGYSDVGGLAILRLTKNGELTGVRAVHFTRVFRSEEEACQAKLELQEQAEVLHQLEPRDAHDGYDDIRDNRHVEEIARMVREVAE